MAERCDSDARAAGAGKAGREVRTPTGSPAQLCVGEPVLCIKDATRGKRVRTVLH